MKKILIIVVIIFVQMIFVGSFERVEAAVKCDKNAAPSLQISDPACYTSSSYSVTVTTEHDCEWIDTGDDCGRWNDPTCRTCGWAVSPICTTDCRNRPNKRADCYTNSCTGASFCGNASDTKPDAGTYTTQSTETRYSYTCYYATVSEWSECNASGIQSATSVTQHSTSGTDCDNLNEATTRTCPACGSANGVATGTAPVNNLCVASNSASTPVLNGTQWNWTCTASTGLVDCAAPHEEDGECSSQYNDAVWNEVPDQSKLCDGGTVSNFVAETNEGPWTWDCDPINPTPANNFTTKNCSAKCFDATVNVEPNPFMWPADGSDAEIEISYTKDGMCAGKYTCTINGEENSSTTVSVASSEDINDIAVECSLTNSSGPGTPGAPGTPGTSITPVITINGYCIAKSCNAQGICQAMPVTSSGASDSRCTNACSSNADCSKGHIIETKP